MDLFVYVPIRSRNVVFQLSLVIQQICMYIWTKTMQCHRKKKKSFGVYEAADNSADDRKRWMPKKDSRKSIIAFGFVIYS